LRNLIPRYTEANRENREKVEIDVRFKAMDATNGKFDTDEFTITIVGDGQDEVDLCVPSLASDLSI
jgi:hypothetical protein